MNTYCLQLGIYIDVGEKDEEAMEHMVFCKPYHIDSKSSSVICNCGKHSISSDLISSMIADGIKRNKIFVRLD